MSDQPMNEQYYVAPSEAPPSRRPPATAVGIIGWIRENLFNSIGDAVNTIITIVLVSVVLWTFLSWAMLEAQWEVAFLNIQTLMAGQQFPSSEIWRIEVIALMIVFLSLLSVGVWGRINRGLVITVTIIGAIMIFVPIVTQSVEEPNIHTYVTEDYSIRQVNFIAEEGQEITFILDPLTELRDFEIENLDGYVENDNQQANTAFDAYNATSTSINRGDRDPADYNLNVAIQVWDGDGLVIAESEFSEGTTDPIELEFTAPYSGWFTYTSVFPELAEGEEAPDYLGAAWLIAQDLEVYRSTRGAQEDRLESYGPPPELDCAGCGTAVNRTDMRFEGTRTVAQWFSLQFSPFLLEIRGFSLNVLIVGAIAYLLGYASISFGLPETPALKYFEQILLSFAALWFVGWIGVQIASAANPSDTMNAIRFFVVASFIVTILLYSLIQLSKESAQSTSQAMTLLWIVSVPVVITLLTGFASAAEGAPLPAIDTGVLGGLTMTLLLSAVAIIASFPLGMILALGRQSELPVISLLCTVFIEVLRGVPLITLLFMGRFIIPFFGFGLGDVDLVIRIMVVLTLFTSAYMAEVIRGGLQIVAKGQLEASYALGLNGFWTTVLIVLPQALRAVIPAMMGQAVSLFKDTSLVYIVGVFEVLGTMNQILGDSQTGFIAFPREGYLFVGIIYFVFSYIMADVSRRIERTGSGAVRRDTI